MSGYVRTDTTGTIKWLPGHDKDLHDMVEVQRRPFLVGGRSSTSSGRSGYRSAATDTHEAAERLADVTGMEIRHLLPSIDDLAHLLRTQARSQVHTTPDGLQFVNRFILVELGDSGIVLTISTGTGAMVSEELEQPHTAALERYAREISPVIAGMFFKRTDRYCRTKHGHVKLYDRLDHMNGIHGMWAGDGHIGRWDFDQPHTSMMLAMMASFGATEATVMRRKTSMSQMRLTGDRMEDGRVLMAIPQAAPVGTMRFREIATNKAFMAIDTPSNYPPADQVVGLPQVVDRAGQRADQVALVRAVLSRWGVDGTDPIDMFVELAEAGMSSEMIRRRYGPAATYNSELVEYGSALSMRASNWARIMRSNLSFYETGVLSVRLGEQSKDISDCFPLDGPWARPEDFARIRAYEAQRAARLGRIRPSRWARSGWQGLEVTFGGVAAQLQGRDRKGTSMRVRGRGVDWGIEREDRTALERNYFVAEEALNGSIVEALRQADGNVLSSFSMEHASRRSTAAQERRDQISTRQAALAAQRTKMVDRMLDDSCSQALLDEIKKRDAVLASEESALAVELRALEVELVLARQHVGADSSDLDKIVAFLRGEYQVGVRDALHRAVRNLAFEAEDERRNAPVAWSGELVIDDERLERGLWRVPFSGRFDPNEGYASNGLVGLMRLLRAGEVMRFAGGRLAQAQRDLAALAGVPQKRLKCLAANEPELVRLWSAIEFPEPVPGEEAADVVTVDDLLADSDLVDGFGGLEATRKLVERMRALVADDGGWLRPTGSSATVATIRNAAILAGELPRVRPSSHANTTAVKGLYSASEKSGQIHRWTFSWGQWPAIVPCAFCGGIWCVPTRIREVAGYLCLDKSCRRDESGVTWPSQYDQYLSGVELLLEAGVALALPDDFNPTPRGLNNRGVRAIDLLGRRRSIADLSEEEREDLVRSYECGEMVKELFDRLGIATHVAYEYLDQRGVTRRSPGRRRSSGSS